MSGSRSLYLSPKLADGITSEAIDESGVNGFMLALAPGIGRARCRFELTLSDANEPKDITKLKPDRTNATHGAETRSSAIHCVVTGAICLAAAALRLSHVRIGSIIRSKMSGLRGQSKGSFPQLASRHLIRSAGTLTTG